MRLQWALHQHVAHAFVEDEVGYVSLCGEHHVEQLDTNFLAHACHACHKQALQRRVPKANPSLVSMRSEA